LVNPGGKFNPAGVETRAAAAWALGFISEGKPNPDLIGLLEARLTDNNPGPGGMEDDRVRQMAAVSLGRIKAKDSLPTLRRFYEGKPTLQTVNNACGWAIEQITGEPVPTPGTIFKPVVGWFLYRVE
jgi:HEAT repeat protein